MVVVRFRKSLLLTTVSLSLLLCTTIKLGDASPVKIDRRNPSGYGCGPGTLPPIGSLGHDRKHRIEYCGDYPISIPIGDDGPPHKRSVEGIKVKRDERAPNAAAVVEDKRYKKHELPRTTDDPNSPFYTPPTTGPLPSDDLPEPPHHHKRSLEPERSHSHAEAPRDHVPDDPEVPSAYPRHRDGGKHPKKREIPVDMQKRNRDKPEVPGAIIDMPPLPDAWTYVPPYHVGDKHPEHPIKQKRSSDLKGTGDALPPLPDPMRPGDEGTPPWHPPKRDLEDEKAKAPGAIIHLPPSNNHGGLQPGVGHRKRDLPLQEAVKVERRDEGQRIGSAHTEHTEPPRLPRIPRHHDAAVDVTAAEAASAASKKIKRHDGSGVPGFSGNDAPPFVFPPLPKHPHHPPAAAEATAAEEKAPGPEKLSKRMQVSPLDGTYQHKEKWWSNITNKFGKDRKQKRGEVDSREKGVVSEEGLYKRDDRYMEEYGHPRRHDDGSAFQRRDLRSQPHDPHFNFPELDDPLTVGSQFPPIVDPRHRHGHPVYKRPDPVEKRQSSERPDSHIGYDFYSEHDQSADHPVQKRENDEGLYGGGSRGEEPTYHGNDEGLGVEHHHKRQGSTHQHAIERRDDDRVPGHVGINGGPIGKRSLNLERRYSGLVPDQANDGVDSRSTHVKRSWRPQHPNECDRLYLGPDGSLVSFCGPHRKRQVVESHGDIRSAYLDADNARLAASKRSLDSEQRIDRAHRAHHTADETDDGPKFGGRFPGPRRSSIYDSPAHGGVWNGGFPPKKREVEEPPYHPGEGPELPWDQPWTGVPHPAAKSKRSMRHSHEGYPYSDPLAPSHKWTPGQGESPRSKRSNIPGAQFDPPKSDDPSWSELPHLPVNDKRSLGDVGYDRHKRFKFADMGSELPVQVAPFQEPFDPYSDDAVNHRHHPRIGRRDVVGMPDGENTDWRNEDDTWLNDDNKWTGKWKRDDERSEELYPSGRYQSGRFSEESGYPDYSQEDLYPGYSQDDRRQSGRSSQEAGYPAYSEDDRRQYGHYSQESGYPAYTTYSEEDRRGAQYPPYIPTAPGIELSEQPPSYIPRHKQDLHLVSTEPATTPAFKPLIAADPVPEVEKTDDPKPAPETQKPADPKPAPETQKPAAPVPKSDPPSTAAAEKSNIYISSTLKCQAQGASYYGSCTCPRGPSDDKLGPDSQTCLAKYVRIANNIATCTKVENGKVKCTEAGGSDKMQESDSVWWQQAFCKRCVDAGGASDPIFECPDGYTPEGKVDPAKEVKPEDKGKKADPAAKPDPNAKPDPAKKPDPAPQPQLKK